MSPGKILKVALRSRSIAFAADYRVSISGGAGRSAYVWRAGDGRAFQYRRGTSDLGVIYDVLLKPGSKGEYWLPETLAPETILDIGGNIGVTSRYLAHRYPSALVHAFEPVPENLELLRANTAGEDRITVHPYALGPADGELTLSIPDASGYNRGGYSAFASSAGGRTVRAQVRGVAGALDTAGIGKVDVIKIDTEGAEHGILAAFPAEILSRVSWIYGELHGEAMAAPAGFKVLDLLSRWFEIETYKALHKKNYFFDACRRDLVGRFRGFRRY